MRVIKFALKTGLNALPTPGSLKLVHLDWQDSKLMGWFLEIHKDYQDEYEVYIAVTGEPVPTEYNYVCSSQLNTGGGYFVVHAFD